MRSAQAVARLRVSRMWPGHEESPEDPAERRKRLIAEADAAYLSAARRLRHARNETERARAERIVRRWDDRRIELEKEALDFGDGDG